MPVARGPRFVADDCAVVRDDAVEQGGFADVRPADQRDYGQVHAATPLGSCSRTSMKSYEGKMGIESASRRAPSDRSSRKTLSSFMVSAGMSAIPRSWRSFST